MSRMETYTISRPVSITAALIEGFVRLRLAEGDTFTPVTKAERRVVEERLVPAGIATPETKDE